jgi:hypothetical protein
MGGCKIRTVGKRRRREGTSRLPRMVISDATGFVAADGGRTLSRIFAPLARVGIVERTESRIIYCESCTGVVESPSLGGSEGNN